MTIDEMLEEVKSDAYEGIDNVMSNFDQEINRSIAEKLKTGKYVAGYPAWNFHGDVWFKDGKYYCAVMQYHSLSDIVVADTIEDLMSEVSGEYGWD